MNPETLTRLQTLLADLFGVPAADIPANLAFGDLPQWDSSGHMDVMLALEEHFGVEVSAETIEHLTSLPAISAYLEERGHA